MKEFRFDENLEIVIDTPTTLYIGDSIQSHQTKDGSECIGYEIIDDETMFDVVLNGAEKDLTTFGFLNILEMTDNLDGEYLDSGDVDEDTYYVDFPAFVIENFTGKIRLEASKKADGSDDLPTNEEVFKLLEDGDFELGYQYYKIKVILESENELNVRELALKYA